MTIAITRQLSPSIDRCELTHLSRTPIDVDLAARQHASYVQSLRDAGCEVVELPVLPDHPDSVFVEDTAVVLDEVAIITRPGAASRRGETDSIEGTVGAYREIRRLEAPATLDGGDVVVAGRVVYVGRSSRTSADGVSCLRSMLDGCGYAVRSVPVRGCLHLKSGCTFIGDDTLLVNAARVDTQAFEGLHLVHVHPEEPDAANALRIGPSLLCAANAEGTMERLTGFDADIVPVDLSELAKAEGAITCCSLIVA